VFICLDLCTEPVPTHSPKGLASPAAQQQLLHLCRCLPSIPCRLQRRSICHRAWRPCCGCCGWGGGPERVKEGGWQRRLRGAALILLFGADWLLAVGQALDVTL